MFRRSLVFVALLGCSGADDGSAPVVPPAKEEPAPEPTMASDAGSDVEAPLRAVTDMKVVPLGTVIAGQDVVLDVPAGALGFVVVVEGASGTTVGVESIVSPSGERVHDAFTPSGGSHATSESSYGLIAAASVPQSENASANPPAPGQWTIRFAGDGPLQAEARIQMGSPNGFVGGRLDVEIWVPDGLEIGTERLDANKAATSDEIAKRLDVFFQSLTDLYAIDRGHVSFLPAAAALKTVTTESALVDAFSISRGRADEQALRVVLTNAIDFGGGSAAWGIAPGIPGAATRSGTETSGIVLAVGDTPAVGDGLTLLHESGHFMGLNHTTELADGLADPLLDTPKCETISIDDPSTLAKCPDKKNLMFPTFYGTSGGQVSVSDAQRRIVHGSPVYKAYSDGAIAPRTMDERRKWGVGGIQPARLSLTKSGRDLNTTETYLAATLCPLGKTDPKAWVARHGETAIAELERAASDPDLPSVVRRKAAGILESLEQ